MVLTFCISFAATLIIKSDHPADHFNSYAEELLPEENLPTPGVPEIKTLFDEQNKLAFNPQKYSNVEFEIKSDSEVIDETPPPPRKDSDSGTLSALGRITSIKPAVDEKIKSVPRYVTLDKLPHILPQAIVSVEDTRFYKHKGFDIWGIVRAVLVNVEAGEIQEGASTITQQTVKNLFLTSDQTFARKAEELILSMNMEKNFSKDKILEIYLNVIYFGSNFYGIYDAAQGYFGREPADLTIAECAMLAGLPNAIRPTSIFVWLSRGNWLLSTRWKKLAS